MRYATLCRRIALAGLCALPACNHVAKRDSAAGLHAEPAAVVERAADAQARQRQIVPVAAQTRGYEPALVPLPADDGTPLDDSLLPPAPGGFPEGALSLAQLEELAIAGNPTLQQAAWSLARAEGIRTQVGLHPNPQIGYSGNEIGDSGRAGQQGGYISQTIVLGEKLKLNRDVLDRDIEALSWVHEAQRLRVLNDLRLAYFDALGAQRRVTLAAELEKVAERGVAVANELFEARQGAKPDILQAEIQLNEVRIIRRNAQNDYETAWRRLAAIVGRPGMAARQLGGELEESVPEHSPDDLYRQIAASSPELHAAHARVESAQALIRRQQAQPIPNLLAQAGAAHDYGSGDDIVNVQLGLPLPLFNRNQGNIAAACAEYQRALQEVERLQLALRMRLNEAYRNLVQARNRTLRIKDDILPRAAENRRLTEDAYRLGEFDFLRVLTARRTYFESNIRYVEALTELRKAQALIDGLLLTGGLDAPPSFSGDDGLRGQALNWQ